MTDDLMTAPELAKYLKVELRTVYRYLKEGQLPAIRMGGRWRFRRGDIDGWLLQRVPFQGHTHQRPRILVVDDDDDFRSMLNDFLQTSGYTTRAVESGEGAMALLEKETFDLLLADLRMPGMDGIELIRLAKRKYPHIRAFLLTGFGDKDSAIEALRLGVTDYLEKPIRDLQTLASAVELALKHP